MADLKKNSETPRVMVERFIPRDPDPKAQQQEFYSVNGKNYILKKGVPLRVPIEVAEVIDNSQAAENAAYLYSQSQMNMQN